MSKYPAIFALAIFAALAGCGEPEEAKAPERAILVTTTKAYLKEVEVTQSAIGSIASPATPLIAAEVPGQVMSVHIDNGEAVTKGQLLAEIDPEPFALALRGAEAEVKRLQALVHNQRLIVRRFTKLSDDDFVSANSLEQSETQLAALLQEVVAAKAKVETLARDLKKSSVISPILGRVQQRYVGVGDYIIKGAPLFKVVNQDQLQVHLPFPETVAHLLKIGQEIRLSTPTDPDNIITSKVSELRPMVGSANRAIQTVTNIEPPPHWFTGASVEGTIILERHQSVMVPDVSVIMRPKGTVVYLVEGERVREQTITKGKRIGGEIEILAGLEVGETVVANGAYYLSGGALITIQNDAP